MTIAAEKIAALPGKPFTHGRSAELYDLGDGRVLKLYFPEFPESDVDLEYSNTRIAFALGCTPMECYAKAECEGRFGVILKKVAGISMTKMPEKNPLILFKAGRLAGEEPAHTVQGGQAHRGAARHGAEQALGRPSGPSGKGGGEP